MARERIVLHIDMDAFFAAIEERDKPRLKGLPIVVGADPKDGKGRGVVSTANYAARKYGIRSAMPIATAWRLSEAAAAKGESRAVFIGVNFSRYDEVSRGIMEYLRSAGDAFEAASVDEAYIEISKWEEAEKKAREIKAYIKKEFELTCSIGIGPNKLVAKIAAGRMKPDGLTIIKPEEVQSFLDPLPVREIPGIGPKSEVILMREGVRTIHELREKSQERLIDLFGKWGAGMHAKSRGIDESPVEEHDEAKSIGEQETFEIDTLDPKILLARLKAMSMTVAARAAREEVSFRTVSITVRFTDFETKTRAHTMRGPAAGADAIEREAIALFLPFLDSRENPRRKAIRLLGIRIEKLSSIAKEGRGTLKIE